MAINDPAIPPVHPGLKRVSELNILGVQISDRLEFAPHVNQITVTAVQSTYALRVLRAHGLNGPNLWEVSRATAVAKLTYACSAWWGYVNAGAKSRIQSTMKKFKRLGFLPEDVSFKTSAKNKITIFSPKFCLMKIMYYINFSLLCGIYPTLFVLGLMTANCLSQTQP